jgi:hypothetical protein
MPFEIAPALEPEEWQDLHCGSVAIDQVGDETHIVVTDPDGEVVSISGPQEIFALIALANSALPNGDPRKITHELSQRLRTDPAAAMEVAELFEKMLPPQ